MQIQNFVIHGAYFARSIIENKCWEGPDRILRNVLTCGLKENIKAVRFISSTSWFMDGIKLWPFENCSPNINIRLSGLASFGSKWAGSGQTKPPRWLSLCSPRPGKKRIEASSQAIRRVIILERSEPLTSEVKRSYQQQSFFKHGSKQSK